MTPASGRDGICPQISLTRWKEPESLDYCMEQSLSPKSDLWLSEKGTVLYCAVGTWGYLLEQWTYLDWVSTGKMGLICLSTTNLRIPFIRWNGSCCLHKAGYMHKRKLFSRSVPTSLLYLLNRRGQAAFGNRAGCTDLESLTLIWTDCSRIRLTVHQLRNASSKVWLWCKI